MVQQQSEGLKHIFSRSPRSALSRDLPRGSGNLSQAVPLAMVSVVGWLGPQCLAMLTVVLILYRFQKFFTLTTIFLDGITTHSPLTDDELKILADSCEMPAMPAEITEKKIVRRRKPNKKKLDAASKAEPEPPQAPKRNTSVTVKQTALSRREIVEMKYHDWFHTLLMFVSLAVAAWFVGSAHRCFLPSVVFTDPQFAAVGLTESQAIANGLVVGTSTISLDNVPRFITSRNPQGFIKLVADSSTKRILGATILAPEAGDSIQTIVMALKAGLTTVELGEMLFPYLTAVEGLKLAAQGFSKDVSKLSCCAG